MFYNQPIGQFPTFTKLTPCYLVNDVCQSDNVCVKVTVGGLVDHLNDGVDIFDGVLIGDDVECDRDSAVDQDPFQGFNVPEIKILPCFKEAKWDK